MTNRDDVAEETDERLEEVGATEADECVSLTVLEKVLLAVLLLITVTMGLVSIYAIAGSSETLLIGPGIAAFGFFLSTIFMVKSVAERKRQNRVERFYKTLLGHENVSGLVVGIIGLLVWLINSSL